MRIWSINPKYLDSKGLVALWRETLLAKNVLEGNTKGYKNHPQLHRFKKTMEPISSINQYLSSIYLEAESRGFNFNKEKINWDFKAVKLNVTNKQIRYEFDHLLNKLKTRDKNRFIQLMEVEEVEAHPLFTIIDGEIEEWEIIKR